MKLSEEDWKLVNRKAAEFWTDSTNAVENIEDGLKALEACYHYIDIQDFERSIDVIFKERETKPSGSLQRESLVGAFGRLGLFQHMTSTINLLIKNVSNKYYLAKAYNELGNLSLRGGDVQKALDFYQKAREMAIECQKSTSKMDNAKQISLELEAMNIKSLFTISTSKHSIGEIEEAIKSYEEIASFTEGTNFHIYAVLSWLGMGVLYSEKNCEDSKQKAAAFAEKVRNAYSQLPANHLTAWAKAYNLLGLGIIHANLGEHEKALEMYKQSLLYSQESHYLQGEGQAINALGVIYRKQNNFDEAIINHTKAIEIANKIKAKSNIADAYYERGITYKKIGDRKKSRIDFEAAIQVYEQMGAPKLVAKVRKAMETDG